MPFQLIFFRTVQLRRAGRRGKQSAYAVGIRRDLLKIRKIRRPRKGVFDLLCRKRRQKGKIGKMNENAAVFFERIGKKRRFIGVRQRFRKGRKRVFLGVGRFAERFEKRLFVRGVFGIQPEKVRAARKDPSDIDDEGGIQVPKLLLRLVAGVGKLHAVSREEAGDIKDRRTARAESRQKTRVRKPDRTIKNALFGNAAEKMRRFSAAKGGDNRRKSDAQSRTAEKLCHFKRRRHAGAPRVQRSDIVEGRIFAKKIAVFYGIDDRFALGDFGMKRRKANGKIRACRPDRIGAGRQQRDRSVARKADAVDQRFHADLARDGRLQIAEKVFFQTKVGVLKVKMQIALGLAEEKLAARKNTFFREKARFRESVYRKRHGMSRKSRKTAYCHRGKNRCVQCAKAERINGSRCGNDFYGFGFYHHKQTVLFQKIRIQIQYNKFSAIFQPFSRHFRLFLRKDARGFCVLPARREK